eukprot:5860447-Amphidinium_carterae.1
MYSGCRLTSYEEGSVTLPLVDCRRGVGMRWMSCVPFSSKRSGVPGAKLKSERMWTTWCWMPAAHTLPTNSATGIG